MEIGNPTTSLNVEAVQGILQNAFRHDPPIDFIVESSETMGFSGAGVANLSLKWEDMVSSSSASTVTDNIEKPSSLFLKHIVIPNPSTAASDDEVLKIERNIQSYKNEFASISYLYPLMDASNPRLVHPQVYYNDHTNTRESNTFTVCAESMFASGWRQVAAFTNHHEINACLEYLANFHALTIGKDYSSSSSVSSLSEMVPGLWEVGTHLALEKRPANELDTLPNIWKDFIIAFEDQHEIFTKDTQEEIIAIGSFLIRSFVE